MNRIDRLVAIVLLLQSRKVVRAQDVAAHFEISIRTVYRDVKALCEAGVPVASEPGEGYSLVEGYHLPPIMFTTDEATSLFLGAKFVEKLTDRSMVRNAESALLKIRAVLPNETQDYLERVQASTQLYLKSHQAEPGFRDDALADLQEAIVQMRVVSMEYYSQHRESFSKREVEPLGLLYYARHWHLISYCKMREDFRDFRTDRIRSINVRDEKFAARKGYSLKEFLQDFDNVENRITVQVKCDRRYAADLRDRLSFALIEQKEGRDHMFFSFVVPTLEMLIPYLLSYGTMIEVVSPPELREKLKDIATRIIQNYR